MNIHEFQAKQLFRDYGIAVPAGSPATSVSEAVAVARGIDSDGWMVKAQHIQTSVCGGAAGNRRGRGIICHGLVYNTPVLRIRRFGCAEP